MDIKGLFSEATREFSTANSTGGQMSLFTGVVITSTAATYTVSVVRESYSTDNADGGNTIQGIVISSHLASFFGFKEVSIPQPGSRVLCASSSVNTCYILGVIPQNNLSSELIPGRVTAGAVCAGSDDAQRMGHKDKNPVIPNNRRPTDVVDGEYVVVNEFGVLLGLFQELATLKASELSQVQCHLLDDLVRIISHNFQHYTALGEYNVWHDGKSLMAEFGATHIPSEGLGRPSVDSDNGGEPIFEKTSKNKPDDSEDFYKIKEDERIVAIERFKVFLGRLGDFLHVFLVKPDDKEVRTLNPENKPTKPDTGLFDFHLGTDGGVHIRSVKEIFLEKTSWIRVPTRYSAPEDPKGDDATEIAYEKKEAFEWTNDYQYKENPYHYFLQIRDYVAYVNEVAAYKNFKTHEKDFYVNDELDKEKKLSEIHNVDEHTPLGQEQYKLRAAGVYLMPNGGITIKDAWNSAIVMEGGNIYIQPAKDLIVQPLRNFIAKVGGWTSIASKEDIDLSSSEKGFRLKTQKSQYFYSDESGIVLQANSKNASTGSPDPAENAISDVGGIVLKSTVGIYNYAETEIVYFAKQNITFQSLKNIFIEAKDLLGLSSSDGPVLTYASQIVSVGEQSAIFISTEGSAICAGAKITALGKKDEYLGIQYDKDSFFIDILKGAVPFDEITTELAKISPALKNPIQNTVFNTEDKFKQLDFKFLSSDIYGISASSDAIPATMAQQDDQLTGLYSLEAWEEKEINSSFPYPGKEKFDEFYLASEAPKNLQVDPSGKGSTSKAKSENKPGKITLKSLKEYKIQK
jgi:hypothetical protein